MLLINNSSLDDYNKNINMSSVYSNNTMSSSNPDQVFHKSHDDSNKYVTGKSFNSILYSSTIGYYMLFIHYLLTSSTIVSPFDMNKVIPFDMNKVIPFDLDVVSNLENPSEKKINQKEAGNNPLTEDENNQINENRNAIKEGKSRRFDNVEEYLKSLEEDE